MISSASPPPNAATDRRASATKPHAANGLVSRRIRLSPANAGAAQAMRRSKRPLKTAGRIATGMGKGTIANTAIPESP
jgi:hypothetical protein